MGISLKPLHEQVIVITGASSGIGLTTALAAAKKGAKVVLASRNKEALEEAEQRIKQLGGQAIHVVADVGKQEEVQKIADAAVRDFGGFDTWVNNAGVAIYGHLEEVSDEDNRRLFDTNFWGVVYGSLTAAKHLKTRGGGAIINLGSVLSDVSIPIQGMYSASKHAVKGFTDALRQELEQEKAKISVTLIKPSSINTPYPKHARNYMEHELTLPPPVYEPEEVANAILFSATHQQRDLFVGSGGKMMSSFNWRSPRMMDWLSENFLSKKELRKTPASHREGSLHQPGEDGQTHGDHKGYVMKNSFYTRAKMHPMMTGAIVAAAGAAAIAFVGSTRSKQKNNDH
ncbi:short-subunit dehydrogenase [Pontibacter ummariensis]|uniref:Short-chain dehydrogenase n=1 Tax=Pontibacter ummariensis TaxID=1610492 RepID=A0A239D3J0_9BACT|nr:SDR family oxidoreductase [Pontibacter ummariensis]PRY14224.1 short-subunit dehydrogenase [Pontibacter ummariensis]SNS26857.1 Short-chain dehydrogenase [Pontibacter ummariensis]